MAATTARRLGMFLALIALLTAAGLTLIGQAGADDGDGLPTPTKLRASTERGSLDVTLDWDDVDGAASYLVRWRVSGSGNRLNDGINVQSSDAVITVARFGEWVARVQACDSAGCGAPVATKFRVRKPRATPDATPLPTATPTPQPTSLPTSTSTPVSTTGELQVSIAASTVNPLVNQPVKLTPMISNAPSDSSPSYKWALDDGEGWFSYGTGSTFSYLTNRPEAWSFRVTVTYGSGASVTSAPVTITWVESQPTPTATPTPEPVSTSTPTPGPSVAIPGKPGGVGGFHASRIAGCIAGLGQCGRRGALLGALASAGTRRFAERGHCRAAFRGCHRRVRLWRVGGACAGLQRCGLRRAPSCRSSPSSLSRPSRPRLSRP